MSYIWKVTRMAKLIVINKLLSFLYGMYNKQIFCYHDINAWTPLHWAAALGNPYIMQALLVHGARQQEKNNTLQTPYDIAKKFHHDKAIALLVASSKSQRNAREQLFTLTRAHHRRLGEDSPVALLPRNDLLLYIGTLVKQANFMHDLAGYPEHEENLWNTLREAITHNDKDTVQAMLDNNTVVRPSEAFQFATQCKNYYIADILEPHAIIKRDFDHYLHALQ